MNTKEEHILNGFRYYPTYEKGEVPKIDHNKQTPELLYKYYPLLDYHVDALIQNHLYASHPFEFFI